MDRHDEDEMQSEAIAAVDPDTHGEHELTDEDLDSVTGGDFTTTKSVDKPTPILFQG